MPVLLDVAIWEQVAPIKKNEQTGIKRRNKLILLKCCMYLDVIPNMLE
jgi:hypothetical protein